MFDYVGLRNEWKVAGYTDAEIAKKIGISPARLSDKLRGKIKTELTGTQIITICELLNKPMDTFKK